MGTTDLSLADHVLDQGRALVQAIEALEAIEPFDEAERVIAERPQQ